MDLTNNKTNDLSFKNKTKKTHLFIKFLFPFYPTKAYRSTKLLTILAILIALRIVFNLIAVPIPGITETISFSWVPLMIMGWFFGPIYGFFLGWITDTLCYLIFTRGLWFWMYSIQEPCVGIISGIFSGIYMLRNVKENNKIWIDVVFQQIIYIVFTVVCYVCLIMWLPEQKISKTDEILNKVYKYMAFILIALFIVIMEACTIYQLVNNKENHTHLMLFIYGSCLVVLLMEIFSFLLGPITSIEYYKYLHNGAVSPSYLKYGTLFYLVPRVIVQSIKCPLESLLLVGIVWSLNPSFTNIVNNLNCRWTTN